MAIPFANYRDRLADMLMESVPGSQIVSDWQYGQWPTPFWVLKLSSAVPTQRFNVLETDYTLIWEAGLAEGKLSVSGMGDQQTTVFSHLGKVLEYFQTKTELLTSAQTITNFIAYLVPQSLSCSYVGESVVGVQGGGQMRVLYFSITFDHINHIHPQEQ